MTGIFLRGRAILSAAVIALILALYWLQPSFLQQIEFKITDAKFGFRPPLTPGPEIVLIAIDKQSIAETGKWPWDRRIIARLIKTLSDRGARVIGMDLLFSSPDPSPRADEELARAIRDAGTVVLGCFFTFSPADSTFQAQSEFEKSLGGLSRFRVPLISRISKSEEDPDLMTALGAEVNIPALNAAAAGCGYYNVYLERDGSVRHLPLFVKAGEEFYPSFAAAVLSRYHRGSPLRAVLSGRYPLFLEIGPIRVPTDGRGQLYINYYGPPPRFPTLPAWRVLAGDVPPDALKGKIVLVGGTSVGDFEMRLTPFSGIAPSIEIQATCIDNMLHGRGLTESPESVALALALIILMPLILVALLPRSGRALLGLGIAAGCAGLFIAVNGALFSVRNIQSSMLYPLLAVAASYLALSMHAHTLRERREARLRRAIAETSLAISGVLDLGHLLPRILDSVMKIAGAARGMLLVRERSGAERGALRTACRAGMPGGEPPGAGGVVSRVASERRTAFAQGRRGGPPSVLCLPLVHRDALLGVLYLEGLDRPEHFRGETSAIIDSLAGQAAIAIENASLYSTLRRTEQKLRDENIYLKNEARVGKRFDSIVGTSRVLEECLRLVQKAASSDIAVLIQGETGTGKELIAQALHFSGPRKDGILVAQNCSALPEPLLESELFGHRKGAFTGAVADKKGLLEIADGGTVFLDEVADMAPGIQAKLLRVLQEGVFRPLGGLHEKRADIRFVSATNKDLAGEVKAGRFREDLYYRLNAFTIRVPPLRERKEDIPSLASHFLGIVTARLRKDVRGIGTEAMLRLTAYDYPGNVREFENEIEKAVVMAPEGGIITSADLSPKIAGPLHGTPPAPAPSGLNLREAIGAVEKELILQALGKWGGNKTRAAEELGVSRKGLSKMLIRLGLETPPTPGNSD